MPLKSALFRGDGKLEAATKLNSAHIVPGAVGDHVSKIQHALARLDGVAIDFAELDAKRYGPSPASAVLAYKKKRDIINRSYQSHADNIVGLMTIAALDKEVFDQEQSTTVVDQSIRCDLGQRGRNVNV